MRKKKIFLSKIAIHFNQIFRICVLLVGMIFLALAPVGCGLSGAADEFLLEDVVSEASADVQTVEDADAGGMAGGDTTGDIDSAEAAGDVGDAERISSDGTSGAEAFLTERDTLTDGPAEQALFVVHICGAVMEPGVYELSPDCRIMDAVEAAGGFSADAAQDARNLAEHIADGVKIRIPTAAEAQEEQRAAREAGLTADDADRSAIVRSAGSEAGVGAESAGTTKSGSGDQASATAESDAVNESGALVNINTAGAAMLQTLPGIGESRAQAIIAYREEYGAFSCIEDIMKVSGIKQAAFDKLKNRITV